MKRVLGVLLLSASWSAPLAVAAAAAREAVCHVCRVREGTTHPEPVRATRTHEGVEYGFCAEKCARAFAADPTAFLPPTFPRPAPAFAVRDLDGRTITLDDENDPAWSVYRVKAVPSAFLIDREGRIVAQWTGAAPEKKALATKLEELLAAEPAAATP